MLLFVECKDFILSKREARRCAAANERRHYHARIAPDHQIGAIAEDTTVEVAPLADRGQRLAIVRRGETRIAPVKGVGARAVGQGISIIAASGYAIAGGGLDGYKRFTESDILAAIQVDDGTSEEVLVRHITAATALEIARIAGIMAAKRTQELIPLCHQINLSKVNVEAEITEYGVSIRSEVITVAQTGVEMEALTAVSVAALTIYDMCKAVQKDIEITEIRLESKTGGKKGYQRK